MKAEKALFILLSVLLLLFSIPPLLAAQTGEGVFVTASGEEKISADAAAPPSDKDIENALEDAKKNALVSYLTETLGEDEFSRLKQAIDSLILSSYQRFVIDAVILDTLRSPEGETITVKAEVTLDKGKITDAVETIARLEPKKAEPQGLSDAEKKGLIQKGNERFLQGEVASGVLLDPARGIELFSAAKNLYDQAHYEEGAIKCLIEMARARLSIGYLDQAMTSFVEAEDMARDSGVAALSLEAKMGRAEILFLTGNSDDASSILKEALDDSRVLGNEELIGRALFLSGLVEYARDDKEQALSFFADSVEIYERLRDRERYGEAKLSIGFALLSIKRYDEALSACTLVKTVAENADYTELLAMSLIGIGIAHREAGDEGGAVDVLREAANIAEGINWTPGLARAKIELAKTYKNQDNLLDGESEITSAIELSRLSGSPSLIAASLGVQGEILIASGKKREALLSLADAVASGCDLRVRLLRGPLAPYSESDRKRDLSSLLLVARDLEKEEVGFSAALVYEASRYAEAIYLMDEDAPLIFVAPRERGTLIARWKDETRTLAGLDFILLSEKTNRLAGPSLDILIQKREEESGSFSNLTGEIAKKDPALGRLLGIDAIDAGLVSSKLQDDTAMLSYFFGETTVFGLFASRGSLEIIPLVAAPDEIRGWMDDLAYYLSRAGASSGVSETSLFKGNERAVTESADKLTRALILPLISGKGIIGRIGFSPGFDLSSLSLFNLGWYEGSQEPGGEMTFFSLGEKYELFYISRFCADLTPFSRGGAAVWSSLVIVGGGETELAGVASFFESVRFIGAEEFLSDQSLVVNAGTVLFLLEPPARIFRNSSARYSSEIKTVAISPGMTIAPVNIDHVSLSRAENSLFFAIEEISSLGLVPAIFFPESSTQEVPYRLLMDFFKNTRELGYFSGYTKTIRDSLVGGTQRRYDGFPAMMLVNDFYTDGKTR